MIDAAPGVVHAAYSARGIERHITQLRDRPEQVIPGCRRDGVEVLLTYNSNRQRIGRLGADNLGTQDNDYVAAFFRRFARGRTFLSEGGTCESQRRRRQKQNTNA